MVQALPFFTQVVFCGRGAWLEAVGSAYLAPPDKLTLAQHRRFLALGWRPPGPHPDGLVMEGGCGTCPGCVEGRHPNWWRVFDRRPPDSEITGLLLDALLVLVRRRGETGPPFEILTGRHRTAA